MLGERRRQNSVPPPPNRVWHYFFFLLDFFLGIDLFLRQLEFEASHLHPLQEKESLTPIRAFGSRSNFHLKGVYILLFRITNDFSKNVGSLGKTEFEKGNYVYVGSAQSSVLARLERHFAKRKKLHWHIDYLTTSTRIKGKRAIYSLTSSKDFECRLSKELSGLTFSKAIRSFGSSDCKHGCGSHLFMLESNETKVIRSIIRILRKLHLRPVKYHPWTLAKIVRMWVRRGWYPHASCIRTLVKIPCGSGLVSIRTHSK